MPSISSLVSGIYTGPLHKFSGLDHTIPTKYFISVTPTLITYGRLQNQTLPPPLQAVLELKILYSTAN